MLYPKNKRDISQDLFKSPTSEYRGAPFWTWNSKLNKEDIRSKQYYESR